MRVIFHECPICGAKETEDYDADPCRTPKGRKKKSTCNLRRFSLDFDFGEIDEAIGEASNQQ